MTSVPVAPRVWFGPAAPARHGILAFENTPRVQPTGWFMTGLETVDCRLPCLWCKAVACGRVRCVPDHEVGNKHGKHRKQDQKHGGCLKGARPGIPLEAAAWHGDHPLCWCNSVRGFGSRLPECLCADRIQIAAENIGGTSGGLKVWCVVAERNTLGRHSRQDSNLERGCRGAAWLFAIRSRWAIPANDHR